MKVPLVRRPALCGLLLMTHTSFPVSLVGVWGLGGVVMVVAGGTAGTVQLFLGAQGEMTVEMGMRGEPRAQEGGVGLWLWGWQT